MYQQVNYWQREGGEGNYPTCFWIDPSKWISDKKETSTIKNLEKIEIN